MISEKNCQTTTVYFFATVNPSCNGWINLHKTYYKSSLYLYLFFIYFFFSSLSRFRLIVQKNMRPGKAATARKTCSSKLRTGHGYKENPFRLVGKLSSFILFIFYFLNCIKLSSSGVSLPPPPPTSFFCVSIINVFSLLTTHSSRRRNVWGCTVFVVVFRITSG